MPASHGSPNKTWIIFVTQRMAADFTSSPPAPVWETGGSISKTINEGLFSWEEK